MAFYNPKKYKKNVAVKVKSTQPHGKETIKNNFKKSIICESDSSLITSNSATKVKVDPFDDAFNSTILPRAELSTTISPPNMSFSKIIAEKELKGSPVTSLEKQLSSSPPKKSLKTPLPSKKKSLSDDVDVHELSSPEQQRRDSIDLKNTSGIKKRKSSLNKKEIAETVQDFNHSTNQKFKQLQDQYEALVDLRLTEPEKLLHELRESSNMRHQAAEKLISRLKAEIITIKDTLATQVQDKSHKASAKEALIVSNCFKFLSELTGTECKEISEDIFELRQSLRDKFLHYRLSSSTSADMTYSPLAASIPLEKLPASLTDDMTFKRADMPIFLYQIFKWLASTSN